MDSLQKDLVAELKKIETVLGELKSKPVKKSCSYATDRYFGLTKKFLTVKLKYKIWRYRTTNLRNAIKTFKNSKVYKAFTEKNSNDTKTGIGDFLETFAEHLTWLRRHILKVTEKLHGVHYSINHGDYEFSWGKLTETFNENFKDVTSLGDDIDKDVISTLNDIYKKMKEIFEGTHKQWDDNRATILREEESQLDEINKKRKQKECYFYRAENHPRWYGLGRAKGFMESPTANIVYVVPIKSEIGNGEDWEQFCYDIMNFDKRKKECFARSNDIIINHWGEGNVPSSVFILKSIDYFIENYEGDIKDGAKKFTKK